MRNWTGDLGDREMTVGDLLEALNVADPNLPIEIFAGGEIWKPKQIIEFDRDDGTTVVEFGCGWVPVSDE